MGIMPKLCIFPEMFPRKITTFTEYGRSIKRNPEKDQLTFPTPACALKAKFEFKKCFLTLWKRNRNLRKLSNSFYVSLKNQLPMAL
jgi:hypothetical protein